MSTADALRALSRFGLGPRPDQHAQIADDPRGWLTGQLKPSGAPLALRGLPSGAQLLQEAAKERERSRNNERVVQLAQDQYQHEARSRVIAALHSRRPFHERLVHFWSNHFTVSANKPPATALVGAYEREAIRPHLRGDFAQLLLAVVHHPAMQQYLDNARSVGPDSQAGKALKLGLNENLAREVLELHTVGSGAHRQRDVEGLAALLTGWGNLGPGHPDRVDEQTGFAWYGARQQPGEHKVLGQRYGATEDETARALTALARHPATARRVAQKLARHFVADEPPKAAVEALERVFLDTEGDLPSLHAALVELPQAWEPENLKLRSPWDYALATARALESGDAAVAPLLRSQRLLGQPCWRAPSPKGWPDRAQDWLGPEAVLRRAEWAALVAEKARRRDPETLQQRIFGASGRASTTAAIRRADAPVQGLALLLASPELQRR